MKTDSYDEIKNRSIKFLMSVVLDKLADDSVRIEAAKVVLKYCKPKEEEWRDDSDNN